MKDYIFIIENNCERTSYLAKSLVMDDYEVADYPLEETEKKRIYVFSPSKRFNAVDYDNILPNSVVFGGNFVNKQIFENKNCLYFSLMNDKEFIKNNSIITAEATAKIIIDNTKTALFQTNILILGCGNLAVALENFLCPNVKKLAFSSFVSDELEKFEKHTIYQDMEFCKYLSNYDVVINTIPKAIFDNEHRRFFKHQPLFVDLASVSCFANESHCDLKNYIHARNLPSITAPKTAGEEIKKSILRFIKVVSLK